MVYAEMRLAGARRTKGEDISEDDIPSTSGRQFMDAADGEHSDAPKVNLHFSVCSFLFILTIVFVVLLYISVCGFTIYFETTSMLILF